MGKEEIEEDSSSKVGLLKRCTTGGSGGSTRWVDGSEVDSESPPWSVFGDEEIIKQGYGSVRRRLLKKPKRVDSFDVEAMEISIAHGTHHKKVKNATYKFFCLCIHLPHLRFAYILACQTKLCGTTLYVVVVY